MGKISSYATLTQAIADWSHRADLTAGSTPFSDYFIQSAQSAIENDIPDLNFGNFIRMMEAPYGPWPINGAVVPVPTDWLGPKVLTVTDSAGNVWPLAFKSAAWIYDNYPQRAATGVPAFISRDQGAYVYPPMLFTAAAGQTVFTLPSLPSSAGLPVVCLEGATLTPTVSYTLSGTVLTLTSGALAGQSLAVQYLPALTATQSFTATSGQTTFALTAGTTVLFATLSGSSLVAGLDYNVAGSVLTLTQGALTGQTLCVYFGTAPSQQFPTAAGDTVFALSDASGTPIMATLAGSMLVSGVDYTVASGALTLSFPTLNAQTLAVYYAASSSDVLIFGPYPDSDYTVQGTYYASAPLLSATQASNWMVQYAPDCIHAACMREAAKFLENAQMYQLWDGTYQMKLKALVDRDKAERWAAATMQVDVG